MRTRKTTLNRFQPWMMCAVALSLSQAFTVAAAAADAAASMQGLGHRVSSN